MGVDQDLEQLFSKAVAMSGDERQRLFSELESSNPVLLGQLQRLLQRDRMLAGIDTDSGPDPLANAWRQAECLEMPLAPEIEGYRELKPVGSGGMGLVFRAQRYGEDFKQEVALKLMQWPSAPPAMTKRFLAEVRILARLEHPGIARFVDTGFARDGRPFVAMEFIHGEPIDAWCDRNGLDPAARIRLVRQMLSAVGYAHAKLVVHRDLKPGNVLVTPEGRVVLLDFGIAKYLGAEAQVRRSDTERFLTPRWASPEQLAGEPITVACDVHAIGLLLYLLLCGNEAFDFDGKTPGEVERTVRERPPPPMTTRLRQQDPIAAIRRGFRTTRELRRWLRGDVELVVLRCLRKDPEQRYRSVDELDADLAAVLDHRPIAARIGERRYRIGKFLFRNRIAVALSSALALTLLVAVAVISVQNLRLTSERDRSLSAIELLKTAFAAANPMRLDGAPFSARQVLDAARQPLEQRHQSHPALYAELAATLAEVEYASGRYRESADLAARALAAGARADLSRSNLQRLRLLEARAAAIAGDSELAWQLLNQASPTERRQPAWLLVEGRLLYQGGHPRVAVERLSEAAQQTQKQGPDDPVAVEVRLQLAQALRLAGSAAQSLQRLDETLAWQLQHWPAEHPQVLITRQHRLIPLRLVHGAEAARDQAAELLEAIKAHFGIDSAMAAAVLASLAQAEAELGNVDIAIDHYRRSLALWREVIGDEHTNTLRVAHNLAYRLAEHGQHDTEAEQLFANVVARGRDRYGDADHVVLHWTVSYSQFLRSRGRAREALAMLADPLGRIDFGQLRSATLADVHKELEATADASGCGQETAAHLLCQTVAGQLSGIDQVRSDRE